MTQFPVGSDDPTPGVPTTPVFTAAAAHADRTERARRHASHCVLLAVVTSPDLAADLIDRAIEHVRDAANGRRK